MTEQPRLSERTLRVTSTPGFSFDDGQAFVAPGDYATLLPPPGPTDALPQRNYLLISDWVYSFAPNPRVRPGEIDLSGVQRRVIGAAAALGAELRVFPYSPPDGRVFLKSVALDVQTLAKAPQQQQQAVDAKELAGLVHRTFDQRFLALGQWVVVSAPGDLNLKLVVRAVDVGCAEDVLRATGIDAGSAAATECSSDTGSSAAAAAPRRGVLHAATEVRLSAAKVDAAHQVKLANADEQGGAGGEGRGSVRLESFDPVAAGLFGGLGQQFMEIVRRTLASRLFSPALMRKFGLSHVKGILLYGPPGTGKTLMARAIAKMLNVEDVKKVKGPELFDKYVGEVERKIRELFRDAEEDQAANGENSALHIILLDELDALCRARGTRSDSGGGSGDNAVTQLLSKIDGLDALDNILIIGSTNRKELIDEALLRPGRLEVHIEVGLPDELGRQEILRIHTGSMEKNGLVAPDVDMQGLVADLAKRTKNFTGAELAAVVKAATSHALMSNIDFKNFKQPDARGVVVTRGDFDEALRDVRPQFGCVEEDLARRFANGIVAFGPRFARTQATLRTLVNQARMSARTPLVSVLLAGAEGSGKTALAVRTALESGFQYVKVVSPDELVSYGTELARCDHIVRVFEDAYRSPTSVVVVDDIEGLLDYVPVGPRFSNAVLQTLRVLVKKPPPSPERKLLVVGTTCCPDVLRRLRLLSAFNNVLEMPLVEGPQELRAVLSELGTFGPRGSTEPQTVAALEKAAASFGDSQIGIKRLIMLTEHARQFADPLAALLSALDAEKAPDTAEEGEQ
eukprot:m51a1_g1634 hypothetical protein (798) ;mRNA; r:295249-297642